jgi:deoxyadenosine/deoxycytidine kinase
MNGNSIGVFVYTIIIFHPILIGSISKKRYKMAHSTVLTRPQIITLEGNIGAGKSTFLEKFKEYCRDRNDILFLQEPVNIWGKVKQDDKTILELFYENQEKYSFPFQMLAYHTRYELLKDAIELAMKKGVKTIIMERSLEADRNIFAKMLYDEGKIEDCNYSIYRIMSDAGLKTMSADKIWWLNTDSEECARRIIKRGRTGEENIPLEYLQKCHQYHVDWLQNNPKVLVVEDSFEELLLEHDKSIHHNTSTPMVYSTV